MMMPRWMKRKPADLILLDLCKARNLQAFKFLQSTCLQIILPKAPRLVSLMAAEMHLHRGPDELGKPQPTVVEYTKY